MPIAARRCAFCTSPFTDAAIRSIAADALTFAEKEISGDEGDLILLNARSVSAILRGLYRVHFLDHGGNIYLTRHVDRDDDATATDAAHRMNVLPQMGTFEVWQDERLVHRHLLP